MVSDLYRLAADVTKDCVKIATQYQVDEPVPSEPAPGATAAAPGGRREGHRQGNRVHRARRKKGRGKTEDADIELLELFTRTVSR